MAFEKITEEELASVGVETLPDRPALQPQEAKEKFEETAKKLLAPKINKLIEALIDATAAAAIGAAVPDALPEATERNVQAVLQAVLSKLLEHERDTGNPHEVKADQVGAYTKKETDEALDKKMQAIGAGDMAKSVYDPQGKQQDIFKTAELPIGYIFDWAPVEGQGIDLSTPEKVAQHFGYGTWKEITGRFTFGRDETHEVGSTGGEEKHALTTEENGQHTHNPGVGKRFITCEGELNGAVVNINSGILNVGWNSEWRTASSGNGQPHNNMPPYLTVYKWQRIA